MIDKEQFLSSLSDLDETVETPVIMGESESSLLIRRGLLVVVFNLFENFLKHAFSKSLSNLKSSNVTFDNLPEKFQELLVVQALKGLNNNVTNLRSESAGDYLDELIKHAGIIGSSKDGSLEVSEYAAFRESSNISHAQISSSFKAIGVKNVWGKVRIISRELGYSLADPQEIYLQAARMRNRSAHVASFNYPYSSLVNLISDLKIIGACLDIILSKVEIEINNKNEAFSFENINIDSINYRYLIKNRVGIYKEKSSITSGKSIKNYSDKVEAIDKIKSRNRKENEILVILNSKSLLSDWVFFFA